MPTFLNALLYALASNNVLNNKRIYINFVVASIYTLHAVEEVNENKQKAKKIEYIK